MNTFIINNKNYILSDLSLLKNFTKDNLYLKPYPHIIINNCLEPDIYNYLSDNYPSDDLIFKHDICKHNIIRPNFRYEINSKNSLKNKKINKIWKLFIDYHSSKEFFNEIISKFGLDLIIESKQQLNNLNNLSIGKRYNSNNDILLDCQVGINSISDTKSSVIGAHLDLVNKIYSGLFYMKNKNDNSLGGNLLLYDIKYKYNNLDEFKQQVKNNNISNSLQDWDINKITKIKTIEYKSNVFIIFLNNINSIHSVSEREPNKYSRRLVNLIGQI